MNTINPDRLDWLNSLHLAGGDHAPDEDKFCALEAVAYIAGEQHSDHPACVDPVIAAFGRAWNDGLPDTDRDRLLKPFVLRMIGTASTPEIQDQRAFMATDWAVRTFTPTWLRLAGLDEEADALEALPEMTSTELCAAAMPVIRTARDAAQDAAQDAAAGAATRDVRAAARAAAGDAAGAAAWDAARDVRDVRDAARAAARAAALAAARAAGAALNETVTLLQASASDLLDRMIRLTEGYSGTSGYPGGES